MRKSHSFALEWIGLYEEESTFEYMVFGHKTGFGVTVTYLEIYG